MVSYDRQTLNSPNPIARYAHRNRLARATRLVTSLVGVRKVLDYGCGAGAFINEIQGVNDIEAIGYEPFMVEKNHLDTPILKDFSSIQDFGPFDVITIFETIEHLDNNELVEFLERASPLLSQKGRILASVPIEIGPALLMKEINRSVLHKRLPENSLRELFLASFFGIAAKRAKNIKTSHKGFDFRETIRFLENEHGPVDIASYGPLPIGTWYGNSQVYFWLTKRSCEFVSVQ